MRSDSHGSFSIVDVGNPSSNLGDRIGFARRSKPRSVVGPIVGGVVGGVAGIAIIALAIFFWIFRSHQQKMRDTLDAEDQGGNVGRFVENKDIQPFPFATPTQPANFQPTSPNALSYASTVQTPVTSIFVEGVPHSPDVNNPLLPPSYDQTYFAGPSAPSQQQQPNPFPGHARKN